ncbi:MAG: putative DNA binding domain-containing protein [Roseburia sp.]|nr:putative DNA binding domain-containing protein [Roseburia sp.]
MTIEEMCTTKERQLFDRKSAKIGATVIAAPMIAFANADGGLLAVGIEDNGEITGIDDYTNNINEILRTSLDFCRPSIMIETETIACMDSKGRNNHILLIRIPQSSELHTNHRDEVFLRVGDKSKKLTFDERLQLMYAKGTRYYENEPVYGSTMDDIDMTVVSAYCNKIGYGKSPEEYMRQNKKFIVDVNGRKEMSGAAILLFGKNPQLFFERARVRFIRYEGIEAKVGAAMNVVKDRIFEGRILELVENTVEFVRSQIKEYTYLGPEAKFVTEAEYRTEAFMVYATIKNKKFVQKINEENTQENTQEKILEYCRIPRSKVEITAFLGYKDAKNVAKNHLKPLIRAGRLSMTIPDKPNSKNQKYVAE